MMAIVSKAVFSKVVDTAGDKLATGDIYQTTCYRSKSKALASLADGGDLYLATVRPFRGLEAWAVAPQEVTFAGDAIDVISCSKSPSATRATAGRRT